MTQVFIVLITGNEPAVAQKLREAVPESDWFEIADDKFAVAFDGTSRDLAEKIGIRGVPTLGSGIVFPITTYSGRADSALWEWLALKLK
jgi:hypothetical protein